MKNMKIEAVIKERDEAYTTFEEGSDELKAVVEKYEGIGGLMRAYRESVEKGFDEIVVTDCIFEKDVPVFLDWARKMNIGWFVFATGFSGAFETMDCFVQNGARVGKFVVKEYTERRFGEEETVRVPGIRINL